MIYAVSKDFFPSVYVDASPFLCLLSLKGSCLESSGNEVFVYN